MKTLRRFKVDCVGVNLVCFLTLTNRGRWIVSERFKFALRWLRWILSIVLLVCCCCCLLIIFVLIWRTVCVVLYCFRVCLESEMAEVSVVNWICYFLLVLLVARLSLHQARYESLLVMKVKVKGGTAVSGKSSWLSLILWNFHFDTFILSLSHVRQIFLILRRRQVSLMDQSLVVCLIASGISR